MSHPSRPDVLTLHAVRILGFADISRIAARVVLPRAEAEEHLHDARAHGWVTFSAFAGTEGWSLTEAGKTHGEGLLAAELDLVGARADVERVHTDFLPLNDVVAAACSAWQLAELGIGETPVTLARTIASLDGPASALAGIESRLTSHLARFAGYHQRFTAALTRTAVDPGWITGTDRDSCHQVWFELHEDLIATLGLTR